MTIFLLSLMGIPPFAGFFGKLYVFAAAVNNDLAWFAVIGALNSVISVYYYVRVMKSMIVEGGEEVTRLHLSLANTILVWVMLVPTVGLMLIWDHIQRWTSESMRFIIGG
jgi:NADH-quinone oxidoreductase subunit N